MSTTSKGTPRITRASAAIAVHPDGLARQNHDPMPVDRDRSDLDVLAQLLRRPLSGTMQASRVIAARGTREEEQRKALPPQSGSQAASVGSDLAIVSARTGAVLNKPAAVCDELENVEHAAAEVSSSCR